MRKVPHPSSPADEAPSLEAVEVTAAPSSELEVGAQLCRAIAGGDGRAFAELVERFQHRIYAFCRRMIGDPEEAEDLAQDVFLTVYRNAAEFRGESSFATWIYRIARNQTLNRIKYLERRGRSARRSLDEVGEDRLGSDRRSPLELVEGQQTATLVQAAIAQLPEQQRVVLVLRDLEGLSYEEIVDITGLAQGTVKSRIHRARTALADRLARTFE